MQHLQKFFLFSAVVLAFAHSAAALTPNFHQSNTITIAADSWCPINCSRPETKLGVGIDLAKAIYEPLGYTVNYQIMPWSDALAKVRTGEVDAVIGASKYDDATLVFPREPVYNITDDFYVLKGNSWRFQGVHTLKSKRLGVIADYGYGPAVSGYIQDNQSNNSLVQFASGEFALRDNIRKLQAQQIDVIVETRPVMEYTLMKMGLEDKLEQVGNSPQAPVYLAFSPASPQSRTLAAAFDAGMQRLGAAGQLGEFYSAYGLSVSGRGR